MQLGFISFGLSAQTWDAKLDEYKKNIDSKNYKDAYHVTNELIQISLNEKDSTLIYNSLILKINLEIEIDTIALTNVEEDLKKAFNYCDGKSKAQCFELYNIKARLCFFNQKYSEAIDNQLISIDCFASEWGMNNQGYYTMLYNLFYGHDLNQSGRDLDFYADQMCNLFIYSDSIGISDSKYELAMKMGDYYSSLAQYEKAKNLYLFTSNLKLEDGQFFLVKYQLAETFIHLESYKDAYYEISQLRNNSMLLSKEQFSAVLYLQGLLDYYQGNYTLSIQNFQESIKSIESDSISLASTYFNIAQSYLYNYLENPESLIFLELSKLNLNQSILNNKNQSINDKVFYVPFQIQLLSLFKDFDSQTLKNELNNLIYSGEVSNYHLAHLYKAKADLFRFEHNFDSLNVNLSKALLYYRSIGNIESIEYLNSLNSYSKDCYQERGIIKIEIINESYQIISKLTQANLYILSKNERATYIKRLNLQINNLINLCVSIKNELLNEISLNLQIVSKSLLLETSREFDQAISQSSDEEMKSQFSEMKQLRKLCINLQTDESKNKEEKERYNSQADSLDKILVNKLGEYAASKRKFEITWKDIQSNITSTEAAIEFARYYDDKDSAYKYLALVVRPGYDYPKLVKLGKEEDIRSANQPKGQDFATLYGLVWRDVDSLLAGVNTVYYSPSGELNNLAFSALCFEAGDSLVSSMTAQNRGVVIEIEGDSSRSCKAVLMDKYSLHQITTTRYLADGTLKKERMLNSSITLLGGINYNDLPATVKDVEHKESEQDFALNVNLTNRNNEKKSNRSSSSIGKSMDYLEGTRAEVNHIATQLNGSWSVQTLSDRNASEHSLKSQMEKTSPGVLHIATHGFAFPDEAKKESKLMEMNQTSTYKVSEDPMVRCGLMLSGSNISWTGNPKKMIEQTGDDGILTAAEVANLDLSNTKLVVLSACETGLGKIEGSEGTFGLKRGFKLAGVEQMIVSLWSVPDKETMELMTLFYTDLTKTLNPVISFEKAQKEMRNKYPTQPEKWAGFVLVR
jgi:hypothetical protein